MDRFMAYLRVPSQYAAAMKGLHWSPAGDAIEFGDGSTFAFPGEIFPFLEGFASQRPLINFAYILHLFYMLLEPRTPFLGKHADALMRAFRQTQRPYRNAGVFCAVLCADIPAVPDPFEQLPFWTGTFELEVGASEPFFTLQEGDLPALPGEVFEARVLFALSRHSFGEVFHWFRHGRGPVHEAGEEVAEKLLLNKPRSLQGILAELAQHQRLSGARPFVEQLISALTLPPRRLEKSELPLGGYSDVTTHGQVEQLLPSQFAFDDLEFIRRHAERELLYFRREEPHVHTREELVVLLDQGVRTWGTVRLVLTAALFALGQLAERRHLPFLVSSTSDGGELLDPLHAAATELQEMLESSDLTAHPGSALERVLSEETDTARDIVLLTHPRNLVEPDVIAAARKLQTGARLFAVAVDERGEVCFSALRGGAPVYLNRFHVDLERTAPPMKARTDPQATWRGDIETVPFPFRFGDYSHHQAIRFAFDAAGEWLLVATHSGMLHATRTDDSHSEILPRGLVQNTIVTNVDQVIGVAGGFVVVSDQPQQVLALHYDFSTRTCTAHRFEKRPSTQTPLPGYHVAVLYLRNQHLLLLSGYTVPAKEVARLENWCVHLSTGDRSFPPSVQKYLDASTASKLPTTRWWEENACFLFQEPSLEESEESQPLTRMVLDAESGTVRLFNMTPAWDDFTPLADNKPVLQGGKLNYAICRGQTLAALVAKPGERFMLHLFRGPQGIPLASFEQATASFTLSCDGRLLAREIRGSQVEVRDVYSSGAPRLVRWKGRFHPHEQIQIQLGERWLLIQSYQNVHLVLWNGNNLVLVRGKEQKGQIVLEDYNIIPPPAGVLAVKGHLPGFLPADPGNRFVKAAWNNLIAVVDRFGEVALFTPTGELVSMFFVFRQQIAVWMPDGTCHGPMSLLGRPATPQALEKIGAALREAWQNSKGAAV